MLNNIKIIAKKNTSSQICHTKPKLTNTNYEINIQISFQQLPQLLSFEKSVGSVGFQPIFRSTHFKIHASI